MPLSARLAVLLAAVAVGGCGEQHQLARPPAAQVPEEAVSDAYALVDVPHLDQAPPVRPPPPPDQAPPVRPLPAARPRSRSRRHVVRRTHAPRVRARAVARVAAV